MLDSDVSEETKSQSQNQSHVTTDGQSVCLGIERFLVLVTRCFLLFDCFCCVSGAPSLTRGGVYRLPAKSLQYLVFCQYVNYIYVYIYIIFHSFSVFCKFLV
jgi:hypothetical protein